MLKPRFKLAWSSQGQACQKRDEIVVTKEVSKQRSTTLLCNLVDVVLTFLLPRSASPRTLGNSPRDDLISWKSNFDVAVKQTSRLHSVW